MGEEKEKKKKKKKKEEAAEEAPEPPKEEKKKSSKKKSSKRKSKQQGSGVFAVFTQKQLAEFKEGFNFIDHDKDGIIGLEDLRRGFDVIGKIVSEGELNEMLAEAQGPISFTMLLTMFAARMSGGVDEDDVIIAAFKAFDEGDGTINPDTLRIALKTWGDKFTEKECNDILSQLPQAENNDRIDTAGVIEMLTASAQDEEEGTGTESAAE